MFLKLTSWENTTPASKGPPILSNVPGTYWLNSEHVMGFTRAHASGGQEITEIAMMNQGVIYASETPEEILKMLQGR